VRLAREAEELEEEVDPGELLLERLDAGLFTLQCALVVVAALWSTGDAGLRRRLLACLHQKGQSLEMVRWEGGHL
jgi:beta-catenin-like protein 1